MDSWVLIRIASPRWFYWVLTTYIFMENFRKLCLNSHQISSLSVPLQAGLLTGQTVLLYKKFSVEALGPYADFWKGGCEFKGFYKGKCESWENSDFETKIRGVNSVSGETMHDFEIICPARGMHLHPPHTHTHCVRAWAHRNEGVKYPDTS